MTKRRRVPLLQRRYLYYLLVVFIAAQAGLWWGMRAASTVRQETQTVMAAAEKQISRTDLMKVVSEHGPLQLWLGIVALGSLLMVCAGLAMNISWLWRRLQGRSAPAVKAARPIKIWSLTDLWRLTVLMVTCAMIAPLAQLVLLWLHPSQLMNPIAAALWVTTCLDLLAVAAIAAYARSKGVTLRTLMASSISTARLIMIGIRGYLALLPLLIVTLAVLGWFIERFGWAPPSHPLSAFFLEEGRWSWLMYGLIFTALAGPLVEELVFRGVLFHALRHQWGVQVGTVMSSALFALLHANWAGFLPIFFLGALLARLYESTGSLIPSMAAHMAHNTAMIILVMTVRSIIGLQGG